MERRAKLRTIVAGISFSTGHNDGRLEADALLQLLIEAAGRWLGTLGKYLPRTHLSGAYGGMPRKLLPNSVNLGTSGRSAVPRHYVQ